MNEKRDSLYVDLHHSTSSRESLHTHHSHVQVGSGGVALLVPGDAGVGGRVLAALDVLDDQRPVGVDSLPVIDGQLPPLPLPHDVAHWVARHRAGLGHLRPRHHLEEAVFCEDLNFRFFF